MTEEEKNKKKERRGGWRSNSGRKKETQQMSVYIPLRLYEVMNKHNLTNSLFINKAIQEKLERVGLLSSAE